MYDLNQLLEVIAEGIVICNIQGEISFFSPGAERIMGWSQQAAIGASCNQVFRVLDGGAEFLDLIPQPGKRRKLTIAHYDGEPMVLAFTGAQWTSSETDEFPDVQIALVFRDVSEEETMHRLVGHFMANIAHEFFTPLSSLAAAVELLMDQAPYLNTAELQQLLTSLHLSVLDLQTFVDNLLESASIEAGCFKIHTRPVNLSEIITEAMHIVHSLLAKHGQWLILQIPESLPKVYADARRTVQVLINLLANASKYGPDDAPITITVAIHKTFLRVSVRDLGCGIPEQQCQYLFRHFARLDSESHRDKAGIGLGLSVVKTMVEAQGGEVGVMQVANEECAVEGAQFWFTLRTVEDV
ncbi:MAG: PAS domain S-box protein [Anaerolineae bacterium]|nr:PAS domain S-box protein [Anaerolineae bacterium]